MAGGRRPLPTAVKAMRGTLRNDRVNRAEPNLEIAIPPCPRELSPIAKREYRRLGRELKGACLITKLDRACLVGYSIAFAHVLAAEKMIQETGLVVRGRAGTPVASPFALLQASALKSLRNFAAEPGASPSSRSRVHAVEQPPATDPLEDFLNAGRRRPADDASDEADDRELN